MNVTPSLLRLLISPTPQVLEPKEERAVFKDWEKMGSEIADLGLWDDEEQPLPTSECARVCPGAGGSRWLEGWVREG